MVRKQNLLIIILTLVLAVSCTTTSNFSGNGSSESQAKREALQELSEFYSVDIKTIKTYSADSISYEEAEFNKDGSYSIQANFNETQQLKLLKAKSSEYSSQISECLKKADKEKTIFGKLNQLETAKSIAIKQQSLQEYIYKLGGRKENNKLSSIQSSIDKLASKKNISLNGDSSMEIVLAQALNKKGYTITGNSSIEFNINFVPSTSLDPNGNFYIASYQLELVVTENGTASLVKEHSGKGTGVTEEQAISKARENAVIWIMDNLGNE